MSNTSFLPCASCATPPPAPSDEGSLYLSPPADEPWKALQSYLTLRHIPFVVRDTRILQVELTTGLLAQLADELTSTLSETELLGTRALQMPKAAELSLAACLNAQPLGTLLSAIRHRWLTDVLRHARLVTHFQPIVSATDPADIFGYECLTRGTKPDGTLIFPNELFAAARSADLMFGLDRLARITAIRSAVAQNVESNLFINFNPTSIYTPSHCLQTTFRTAEEVGLKPNRVIFEVVESDEVRDANHLLGILKVYRKAGFMVALDDVGAGYNSLNMLARLRPDFVKLDMELTRGVDQDPYKARVVSKLLELSRELDVRTVVEGVETVGEWCWARDHGADFVQGYLFARPATPPPKSFVPQPIAPVAITS